MNHRNNTITMNLSSHPNSRAQYTKINLCVEFYQISHLVYNMIIREERKYIFFLLILKKIHEEVDEAEVWVRFKHLLF